MKSVVTRNDKNNPYLLSRWRVESGVFTAAMGCIGRDALRDLCTIKVQHEGRYVRVMILDEQDGERLAMSPLRRLYAIKQDGSVTRFQTSYEAALAGWGNFESFANKIIVALYQLGEKSEQPEYSHATRQNIQVFFDDLRILLSDEGATSRTARLSSLIGILQLIPL